MTRTVDSARKTHRLSLGVLYNGDNLFQEQTIEGIRAFASESGLDLFAFDAAACSEAGGEPGAGDAVKVSFCNLVNKRLIAGLLILSGAFPSRTRREENQLYKRFNPLPLVTVGFSLPGAPSVLPNWRKSMIDIVLHLARVHGRKRIAFIAGPEGAASREKIGQFEEALRRAKLPLNRKLIITGDYGIEGGRRAAALLAAGAKPACDAVLAANDAAAAGAMEELVRRGIDVPDQCSVAGWQDEELAAGAFLPLTTVRLSRRTIGWKSAELLAGIVRGTRKSVSLKVPAEFIVRRSCGCPSRGARFPTETRTGRRKAGTKAVRLKKRMSEISALIPPSPAAARLLEKKALALLDSLPRAAAREPGAFNLVWRNLLCLVAGLRLDPDPWINLLSLLRRDALEIAAASDAAGIEAVFSEALTFAAELKQRSALFSKSLFLEQALRLRAVEHRLLTAVSPDEVRRVVLEDFPRLGVTACSFSLHVPSRSPLHYSRLAAGYDGEKIPAASAGRAPFLTNRLFPPGAVDTRKRTSFFIEPLYAGTEFLGLCNLSVERTDLALIGILRKSLQGALLNSSRRDSAREARTELEARLSSQARELLELSERFQREKRTVERLREELNRSEERYRKWFEEDFTGNFIAAANGDIINCNAAFARIFGFHSVAEAHRANFGNLYPNKSALEDFYTLLGVVRRIEYYESEFVRQDGTVLHIIGNIIGSFDEDNNLVEMQGFLFDNTERKRLEDELRHAHKMDAIGRLAGGIAHDFNNILTGIMGYAELLLDKIPKSDPSQRDVEEIKKAAKSAASLTRQLLAFSRKQILKPLYLDLNDVVQSMRDLLIRIIGEHISLVTELDPDLKPVKADRGQIEQVIMNLVINSRDALPQGGTIVLTTRNKTIDGTIELSTSADIKPGPYVVLEVCDNGVGMDLETQSHIFEPFFSTKKPGQGVGLGLSTVYGIITQSGGFPEVVSEPHRGTTMRIYLPQYSVTAEVRAERLSYTEEMKGNETILLVEDEDFVRELAEKVLSREGYHVLAAHNAQEALSLVKKHSLTFDLVVTDIVMPGASGVELGQKIQALRPEIKVLYMSGYDDKMLSQHGESVTRLNFIQKPFTPELFLRKVQDALNR
ncbi:MAG: substrate-binding domain-containing protein [Spirochaetales bacterium]|nr:substrate-binding domain-containing protein [Spirochaetales bacterium]